MVYDTSVTTFLDKFVKIALYASTSSADFTDYYFVVILSHFERIGNSLAIPLFFIMYVFLFLAYLVCYHNNQRHCQKKDLKSASSFLTLHSVREVPHHRLLYKLEYSGVNPE